MAINAAPSAAKSSGRTPADCEASMMSGTPASRQRRAMSEIGRISPKTLDTCVQMTASALAFSACAKASTVFCGEKSGAAATMTSASSACSGRVTALCS